MNYLLTLVLFAFIGSSLAARGRKGFCKDEMKFKDCQFYKKLGMCDAEEYKPSLADKCPMTCNLCTYGLVKEKENCGDKDGHFNCQYLKKHGVCQTHANIMADRCAKTCDLCDAGSKCAKIKCFHSEVCALDENKNAKCICPNYCPNKKGYHELGKVCGSDQHTYKDYCHLQHHSCREKHNITVTSYGHCKGQEPCEDAKLESERGMCKAWKKLNLCGDQFYGEIMKKYCKRTCDHCPRPGKIPHQPFRGECDHKSKSPYGCCWDLSKRPAPPGRCDECKDKFPGFCSSFMQQCNSVETKNTVFMKRNCPVTCGFCIPEKKQKIEIKIYSRSGQRLFTTKLSSKND